MAASSLLHSVKKLAIVASNQVMISLSE